ncbi:MAG: hypothetical protein IT305_25115 [Chloroflexi bacterium]|nr:hypothetical protein [Chloroflexota bacterium]
MAFVILTCYVGATTRAGLLVDDAGQYVRMAESWSFAARVPYTFRILTPVLAGLWPSGVLDGFTAVTLVGLALAATALYTYQRALGRGAAASLAGALLFAVSGGTIRLLTTPTYVDALTYLTEAAAFVLLARSAFWPFLVVVIVGVLNRETALALVVMYLVVEPPARTTWGRAGLVVVLPILALGVAAALKLGAAGILDGSAPLGVLQPGERAMQHVLPTLTNLFDLYSTFGVLWLLALRHLPGPTRFERRALAFGVAILLQLVVARGDEGRVLSHLFPLVVPLAMLDVERLSRRRDWTGQLLAGILVVACAASMVHARWTILESVELRYALVAAGTVVALAIAWLAGRWTAAGEAAVDARADTAHDVR